MGNPYPVQIADAGGGTVKVAGDLTFTDPANQPGGGGSVLSATKTVTSAEILDLASHPVTLVAAPAAGSAVLPLAVFAHLNFITAAYVADSGAQAELCLGANGDLLDVGIQSIVTATQSRGTWVSMPVSPPVPGQGSNAANDAGYVEQPFVLANFGGGDFITGGGSLDFTIFYVLVAGVT